MLKKTPKACEGNEFVNRNCCTCAGEGNRRPRGHPLRTFHQQGLYSKVVDGLGSGVRCTGFEPELLLHQCPWGNCTDSEEEVYFSPSWGRNKHSTCLRWSAVLQFLSHLQHFCRTMDCSPPDSSVHGIFQGRILEWVATSFSRWSVGSNKNLRIKYFKMSTSCLLLLNIELIRIRTGNPSENT